MGTSDRLQEIDFPRPRPRDAPGEADPADQVAPATAFGASWVRAAGETQTDGESSPNPWQTAAGRPGTRSIRMAAGQRWTVRVTAEHAEGEKEARRTVSRSIPIGTGGPGKRSSFGPGPPALALMVTPERELSGCGDRAQGPGFRRKLDRHKSKPPHGLRLGTRGAVNEGSREPRERWNSG
jgi:hypothetical protein